MPLIEKNSHPAGLLQVVSFLAWTLFWVIGAILPARLGVFFHSLRDIAFLVFGISTIWVGWLLRKKKFNTHPPATRAYLAVVRIITGKKNAQAAARKARSAGAQNQLSEIHLLVGLLITGTTLLYLLIL